MNKPSSWVGAALPIACPIIACVTALADEAPAPAAAPTPQASCPAPTTVSSEKLTSHQWSSHLVDATGQGWDQFGTLNTPYIQTETLITVPSCAVHLAPALYWLHSNNLSPDDGFGTAVVGVYDAYNGSCQKWRWDGAKLSTPLTNCNIPGYLAEAANKTGTMTSNGDPMIVLQSGSGYTIQDMRTGDYLMLSGTVTGAPGSLIFGATQTVWIAAKQ